MTRLSGLRVLIVEDAYLITLAIRCQVRELSCQVVGEAADGQEALDLAETRRPDVILMDDRLPHLDGLEATRQMSARSSLPIVLLAADDSQEARAAAQAAGVRAFLGKLPSRADLEQALRKVPENTNHG